MYTSKNRVKATIARCLQVHENECTDNADIERDLGADSLDKMDLIMELEREFNRSFNDDDFKELHTVGQIVAYIDERVMV